jgi:ArsR family metal-binding transcriptional regulator
MLIERYDVEIHTPDCAPSTEGHTARARLTADISEVLPYLNGTLRGAIYVPAANALTWKKPGHSVAFHAYDVAVSNVPDRESAEKELRELVELVNDTWQRRAEITANYETRQRPTHMAIYKCLPKTNCKRCGEATCYSFALKLTASQKKLTDCLPLAEEQYAKNVALLEAMLIDAPAPN